MKKSWFIGYMKEKGIYLAMAVCIIGASAAAWAAANRSSGSLSQPLRQQSGQVDQIVSGEEKVWNRDSELSKPAQPQSAASSASPAPAGSSASSSSSEQHQPSSSGSSAPAASSAAPQQQPLSWRWPVSGNEVIAGYSAGELVKNRTLNVWRTHDALDLAAAQGETVRAVADGTITAISHDPLWGGMVELEHADGYRSICCGVEPDNRLNAGDTVKAGDVIGTVGEIPSEISEASHIHLILSKDGSEIDPAALLGA